MQSGENENKLKVGFLARFSWAGYDFANTIYSFVVLTLAGARYFDAAGVDGELFYGIAFFASMIASGFIVPFIGATCDRIGFAKLGVVVMTVITIASMIGMSLTMNLAWLVIFLFIGNISYQSSLVLYDTLLPMLIKSDKDAGKLSGIGVGLGYLGSIAAIALIMAFIPAVMFKTVDKKIEVNLAKSSYLMELREDPELPGEQGVIKLEISKDGEYSLLPKTKGIDVERTKNAIAKLIITQKDSKLIIESKSGEYIKITFSNEKFANAYLIGALLFFLTTLPFVFFVPEKRVRRVKTATVEKSGSSMKHVFRTLKNLPKNKPLMFFLLGAFLCQDVLNTSIIFLSKISEAVYSPGEGSIMMLLILVNLSGAAFGFILGFVTDRIGGKKILIISGFSTAIALLFVALLPKSAFGLMMPILVVGGGLGIAGFWTAGRKLLIDLAPKENISEYFGFYNLTKKLSVFGAILLPTIRALFSQSMTEAMSYRAAILAQMPFLILGIIFLFLIKMPGKKD